MKPRGVRWFSPAYFLGIFLLLPPVEAGALELIYHTYNGLDETVSAFHRLALIFADTRFRVIFPVFAITGVLLAVLNSSLAAAVGGGKGFNPVSPMVPILLGLAIVSGALFPRGSLHVYDHVRNGYVRVNNIPVLVVLLAGGFSTLERSLIQIVDTASATPYSDSSGALSYSLIRAAHRGSLNNYYLEQSLVNYYLDCGVVATGQGTSGNRRQQLLHGTDDLQALFGEWKNPALFTTYHADGSDGGEVRSCESAWEGSGGLKAKLQDEATFQDYMEGVCEEAGFDVTPFDVNNPDPGVTLLNNGNKIFGGSSQQVPSCKRALERATALFGVSSSSGVSSLLRAMVLARAVFTAMNSADFSQAQRTLVNRQVIAEGFGSAQAMDQWVPKVRAFLTAIILGSVPVLALFLVTPAFQGAIVLLLGLFSWLMLWGVCDAVAVQMAEDAAADAFNQIRRQRLGIEAILHSPEAAVQALGVFGKARMVAITLATVLSGSLFKFGGYAFARMGEQWQSHLEQAGESAGRQTMLPEEQAGIQRSLVGATALQGGMGQVGFDHMAGGQAIGEMRQGALSSYISKDLGMNGGDYSFREARSAAVNTLGTDQGIADAAAHAGRSYSDSAISSIAQSTGESHVGASARRSFGHEVYGNSLEPAARDAKFGIGRTRATDDAVAATAASQGGLSDGAAIRETFRTLVAGEIAKAGTFTSSEAVATEQFQAESSKSHADEMRALGVSGSDAGRARAFFEAGQSKATLAAGPGAVEAAERLSRGEATGRAAVASALSGGDPFSFGKALGSWQGAGDASSLWRNETVSQTLGLNPEEIRDKVSYRQMSDSQTQLTLPPDLVRQVADNPSVNLSPEQRDYMRERPDSGLAWNFNLSQDGEWVASSVRAGVNVSEGNFTSFRSGMDYQASADARGGNRLLESGHVENLMERAFSLDGSADKSWMAAFGKGYGGALSDRGFTLSSQQAEEFSSRINSSAFTEASGEKRVGLSFLGTGASARFAVGARGSLDRSSGETSTESIHKNGNLLLMQGLGAGAMEQARNEYREQHGALPVAGSQDAEQIYARAGALFRNDFESLVEKAGAGGDKAFDAIKKMGKKSGPELEKPRFSLDSLKSL